MIAVAIIIILAGIRIWLFGTGSPHARENTLSGLVCCVPNQCSGLLILVAMSNWAVTTAQPRGPRATPMASSSPPPLCRMTASFRY